MIGELEFTSFRQGEGARRDFSPMTRQIWGQREIASDERCALGGRLYIETGNRD